MGQSALMSFGVLSSIPTLPSMCGYTDSLTVASGASSRHGGLFLKDLTKIAAALYASTNTRTHFSLLATIFLPSSSLCYTGYAIRKG